jgi:Fe-S oxidoreductase
VHEEYEVLTKLKSEITEAVQRCVRCRFCVTECPVYEVSNGWVTSGASGITQSLYYGIAFGRLDENLRNILLRCTTCRSCEIICEKLMAGVKLVEAIEKGRRLLLELGINPMREQQKALESLQTFSNPYGEAKEKRTLWAKELDVPFVQTVSDVDILYFVGCTTAYDGRVQEVAKSFVKIMKKAEIQVGILKEEKCCGEPAYVMGEEGLFEILEEGNLQRLESCTISNVVVTCPHGFNTFRNRYPESIRKKMLVRHHTQFIRDLIASKKLRFENRNEKSIKVTYHDPCYLGKHNGIYEEPREVLKSIPGVEMLEMKRSRQKSLCCGGGGGRMWLDFEDERKLSEVRIEEALATGAEVLVTACPFCLVNLEDAAKTKGAEEKIRILDIAELVAKYI